MCVIVGSISYISGTTLVSEVTFCTICDTCVVCGDTTYATADYSRYLLALCDISFAVGDTRFIN